MRFIMIVLTVVLAGSIMSAAHTMSLTISVQSYHPNIVSLEFYSQKLNRAWPGDGDVYLLKDSEVHKYHLECSSGENICYGAWVRGDNDTYWGVGLNDRYGCTSCCFTCGTGNTRVQVLNP